MTQGGPAALSEIQALLAQRRSQEAISRCAAALALEPASSDLLYMMGLAFEQAGEAARAVEALDRSLVINPTRLEALGVLANLHSRLNQPAYAIGRLEQARTVDPRHPSVRFNLGNALLAVGRAREAAAEYEVAVSLKPDHHGAWHQIGVAKLVLNRAADALPCVRKALSFQERSFDYRLTEAACLNALGLWAEAIAVYRMVVAGAPQEWRSHLGLAICLSSIGAADQAEPSYLEAVRLCTAPAQAANVWSNYLMSMQYRCDVTRERLVEAHRAYQAYQPVATPPPREPRQDGKLRIGFVSADFFGHPVGYFCLPVLQGLDRDRFSVFGYSASPAEDGLTTRLRAATDGWREIRGVDARSAAALVAADAIDVLVDLSGHTGQRRLDLFALRPAPRQVGWLGYPGPYAWGGIDYRMSDAVVDPVGTDGFGDAVMRLDRTPLCYPTPNLTASPDAIGQRGVTFGSFNNLSKLDGETLSFWRDLLEAFPDSTLALKGKGAGDPAFGDRLDRAFGDRRGQVRILDWTATQDDHLARYAEIDIALDPLFYNGTTTTCEALASGTPVLSRRGDRPAGRMGDSLLASADQIGWVQPDAKSAIDFLRARAPSLAPRAVQQAVAGSRLCDRDGFVKGFGEALISLASA